MYIDSPIWLRQKETQIIAEDNNSVATSLPVLPDVEPFLNKTGTDGSSGCYTPENKDSEGPYLIEENGESCQSPYRQVEELIRRVRSVGDEHS